MNKQDVNCTALGKAVAQLRQGVEAAQSQPENELMRDGVIQRFEYTMDLAWKLMQRYLKVVIQIDDSLIYTKKDIFREAAKLKLIADAQSWLAHYSARNQTSHDYNRDKAQQVYNQALLFLPDAQALLTKMTEALA